MTKKSQGDILIQIDTNNYQGDFMDIMLFTKILKDSHFPDYGKLQYKYKEDFNEFLSIFNELYFESLPLKDFDGNDIVFSENYALINQLSLKQLLRNQNCNYGTKAAENEIIATSSIESIDFSRESVRKILKGLAPKNNEESRILGIKNGLEYISDISNKITEENLYKLYMMTVGDFVSDEDKLKDFNFYRHDSVFVVSDRVEHCGLPHNKLPEYMKNLILFINRDDNINDLVKACIIHFYISYIHPYFDGNGRIARLVHLWFLVQKGYKSALFVPFSSEIEKSRKEYYNSFTLIENNKKFSGKIDVTPFIIYFINNVYNKIKEKKNDIDIISSYDKAFQAGKITEKEAKLWQFVLSFYGTDEFSTKQLEKDFGDAAYATIRSFVMKFENLELLTSVKYGVRTKYTIKGRS